LDVHPVFFETAPFKSVKIDSTELGEERTMSPHKPMTIGIKKGVTLLIFIGLFFLVLCVVLGYFVTKHLPQDDDGSGDPKLDGPVCLSTACLRVSARIQENISPDVDPCDNFAAFACGNYAADIKLSPGVRPTQVHDNLANLALLKSRMVLEAPVRRATKESTERKVKDLFASCVSHSETDSYKFSAVKRVLYKIGGWDGNYEFLGNYIYYFPHFKSLSQGTEFLFPFLMSSNEAHFAVLSLASALTKQAITFQHLRIFS
jgi:hypothetical protein